MAPPPDITNLRHRVDHINGGVPCRTPELALTYHAEHFAFDVERKLDSAADATAVNLGRALSIVLAQTAGALAEMTAAGFTRIGPINTVQDMTATLVPGQGYSYRLRPVKADGEVGSWTAWLTGVAVKIMGVPAIDAMFTNPNYTVAPYRPAGRGSGTPFPSHRLGVLHLMAWNGSSGAAQIRNMGLSTDGNGTYDMERWFVNYVDPLGDLGQKALHIFRGPWGANLFARDSDGDDFGIWNMPGGVSHAGNIAITGLMTPAEMIRRHGHDNTLFADVSGIGSGAFGASNYLVTWMTAVPARIALGHSVHVYMAGPPRNAVSDNWLATIKSPLVAGIPLATGCSMAMDTFSAHRRDETVTLAGLESVSPSWVLLEYLRSIGYQPGWEPPTRKSNNPDLGGPNGGPDLIHTITATNGGPDSRWQLFQRLAGGAAPTDFPAVDSLLTTVGDRVGYALAWLELNGMVPLNVNTPEDNLRYTIPTREAMFPVAMDMLGANEPRLFPVFGSHISAGIMWTAMTAAQRTSLTDAAEVQADPSGRRRRIRNRRR